MSVICSLANTCNNPHLRRCIYRNPVSRKTPPPGVTWVHDPGMTFQCMAGKGKIVEYSTLRDAVRKVVASHGD